MRLMGYEDPVVMPTMGIYNTDLMKTYIQGVKEQYDTAREEMKDFMKQHQDFYSPILEDNNEYFNKSIGGAQNLINQIYEQGIDPFKSPQARSAISKYIASVPVGQLNGMKQSAKNAQTYLENKAKLQAAGKWNQAYEDMLLGGKSLDNWNTATDGVWNRLSPNEYTDLFDMTNPWFADMKDSYLYSDDKYDYTGVSEEQMIPILDQQLSDFLNSDLGKFHYNTFKKQLPDNVSESDALQLFKNEILSKNERIIRINRDSNPYSMEKVKFGHEVQMEGIKNQHDKDMENLRHEHGQDDMMLQFDIDLNKMDHEFDLYGNYKNKNKNKSSSSKGGGSGEEKDDSQFSHLQAIDDGAYNHMYRQFSYNGGTKFKLSSGEIVNVVKDDNGPLVGTNGKYRLATEHDVQTQIINHYANNDAAWNAMKQRITDNQLKDYLGFHPITQQGKAQSYNIRTRDLQYLYDIDHIMSNATGNKKNTNTSGSKEIRDLAKAGPVKETGFTNTVILDKSGNRKAVYLEVIVGKDKDSKKAALKIGEYRRTYNSETKSYEWSLSPSWQAVMTEMDKKYSKYITSEKSSVDISNVGN